MKSFIATAILLAGALQASAQSLTVISTTSGGNGCPQAAPPTISVTSSAISYTGPSTWAASTGPGVPITQSRANCQINVQVGIPANWRFRFASTSVPVTASTPSGNSATVTETYFFSASASVSGTGTSTITSTGPTTVTTPYSPATVWSPCGGTDAVNINTAIRAVGSAAGSIQVTGAVNTPIIWETC
ncbi:hypothetical protein D9611_010736 [Ephemerocybe angulata]|uniref:Secreted protein n=1 Tax=Ephemerocybe angulata TaxID=980116 RepID=A0A8H5F1P7_9AGAR|nr:hypothetical protein D9611_010736 [Tulosesus angulatus]